MGERPVVTAAEALARAQRALLDATGDLNDAIDLLSERHNSGPCKPICVCSLCDLHERLNYAAAEALAAVEGRPFLG